MAILTGAQINSEIQQGHIRIGGYQKSRLQPNSYDMTLAPKITWYEMLSNSYQFGQLDSSLCFESFGQNAVFDRADPRVTMVRTIGYLDTRQDNPMHQNMVIPEEGFILFPRVLYLVETNESVWSDMFVPEITGCSSLARLGISVHKTAGYANLGHEFKWVLEVNVVHPVKIYPNMKIGQCVFHTVAGKTDYQYEGVYKNVQMTNENIVGSLYFFDQQFEENRKAAFDKADAEFLAKEKEKKDKEEQKKRAEELGKSRLKFLESDFMEALEEVEDEIEDGSQIQFQV